MPALILGIVAGTVALYNLAGWVMSWGNDAGFLATGLIAVVVLAATAIGSSFSNANIGTVTTLAVFRWLLIIPLLGSAVVVIGYAIRGNVGHRDVLEAACYAGVAALLLVPEILWLRKMAQRKSSEVRDA